MSEFSGVTPEEIYRVRHFEFYSAQLQQPLLLAASATALFILSRSLRLRSNILHVLALFTLTFFFGFVCNLVVGSGGLKTSYFKAREARRGGIQFAYEFQTLFQLLALAGTQFVACQLVYPDSKPSEKWIYRIITGFQAVLAIVIFGIRMESARFIHELENMEFNFDSSMNSDRIHLEEISRYIIIAFYGIGLLFTTLIMWGSLRYRRQKATFPQTTQKRIVGYAITFPMFIVYIFSMARAAFQEIWWRLDSQTVTERFIFITVPTTLTAFSWLIFCGLFAYFMGWIFLVKEWKKGNRASEGNVSMADYDLKPKFLVAGGHNGGKDTRSSVSV